MISETLKEKIKDEIEDKADFDAMMQRFKMSEAPLETRQEAMNYLKAQYPHFDVKDTLPTKQLLQEIKDGQADIDDINGW